MAREIRQITLEEFETIVRNDTESELYVNSQIRGDEQSFMEFIGNTAEKLTEKEKALFTKF